MSDRLARSLPVALVAYGQAEFGPETAPIGRGPGSAVVRFDDPDVIRAALRRGRSSRRLSLDLSGVPAPRSIDPEAFASDSLAE